jgi:predicted RNA-binding protein YlqC (UPF0109 family)
MEELIQFILSSMVDAPDQVSVNRIRGRNGLSIYEVKVDKTDTGKIIGRQGRNAAAIRTIVDAVAKRNRQRAILEILE